jgi:hypothetical protein
MVGWLLLVHHKLWTLEANELFSWLVEKSEKQPLGKPRRRVDNIMQRQTVITGCGKGWPRLCPTVKYGTSNIKSLNFTTTNIS